MALLRTLIVGSLLAGLVGTAAPASARQPGGEAPATAPALGADDALHVGDAPGGRALQTADGRRVLLRGANVNALIDYDGRRPTVPVTDDDARQAAALGFTVVRLGVSWSRIEPQPGTFDPGYLAEVRTAAQRFVDAGVYVLLDLHQDRYAAGLGPSGDESDGAPAWAAVTDGASTAAGSGGHPYYGTAASRAAADNFFANAAVAGKGLQEHYADAVARVAAVGEDLGPGLAGVELLNEPVDPVQTDPFAPDTFTSGRLHPLYARLIARLRGPDGTGPGGGAYDGPVWFEGHATRTWTDDDRAAAAFSSDPNLVYGPHVYTDVYDGEIGEGTRGRLAASFDNAAREAAVYGAALAPTELPGASGGPWEEHRAETLRHLDRLGIGGMVWVWKQDPAASYGWGVLNADGSPRTDSGIARDYGRARLVASAPAVRSTSWSAGVLTVRTAGAGPVDLWDGAAFGPAPPAAGVASRLTLDGVPVPASAVEGRTVAAPLGPSGSWAGGRRLRVVVPAGDHTLVLRPAATRDPEAVEPPAADRPAAPEASAGPPASTSDPVAADPTTPRGAGARRATRAAAPAVVSRRVAPARFRPAGARGAAARRGGARLTVVLRGASHLRIAVERRTAGWLRGGRCVVVARRPSPGATRCARFAPVDTRTVRAPQGRLVVRITGRVGRRPLAPGAYRLRLTPLAPGGHAGAPATAALAVLPAPR